jgi:cardiolipin synthase A/B
MPKTMPYPMPDFEERVDAKGVTVCVGPMQPDKPSLRERVQRRWRAVTNEPEGVEGTGGGLPAPFSRHGARSGGNRVVVLHDADEAYPAMIAAIALAKHVIHCEMYILDPDEVGGRFVRALAERARSGVSVRLMVDAVGSYRLPGRWLEYLSKAGVDVHVFNPIRFAPLELLTKRNHRKMLVVDRKVAFTGGMNISMDHVCVPRGKAWRDCMVQVAGPVVLDLDDAFVRSYRQLVSPHEADQDDLLPPETRDRRLDQPTFIQLQSNALLRRRYTIRNAYVRAIKAAEREIIFAHSYFVPDLEIRRALKNARQRGVRIRLLLPGVSDVPIVKRAMEALYAKWFEYGIEVREWRGAMLHLKISVFDGRVFGCGSYNLDDRSLRKNLELALWITGTDEVKKLVERLEVDWARCQEVTPANWHERPLLRRMREWIAFRLRKRM